MKNVQRFEITDTIKEPPTYGGRLDENGNSLTGGYENMNIDVKQAREDMATPEQALATLKAAEAGYYMNDDRQQGNAARTDERPLDDTATPEQALAVLKAAEADSYLQEV